MAFAPTNVSIIGFNSSSISMSWVDPNAPDEYCRTFYKIRSSSLWIQQAQVPPGQTEYYFYGLIPGAYYDVGVATWDGAIESEIISASTWNGTQTTLETAFTGSVAVQIWYAFVTASEERRGVYIGANNGSPHISLKPITGSPETLYEGDIWYSSSVGPGSSHLFIGQRNYSNGQIDPWRFVTVRNEETTISDVLTRFSTADAPTDLYIGANAFVSDNPFTTVNTISSSGALIKNETWGDGFYMPDSESISIFADANFVLPSSSLIIETGSLIFRGNGAIFDISGSGISASILGQPIVSILTGSTETSSFSVDPIDGTLYINTASSAIQLRANNNYYSFGGGLPAVVDGGTY